MSDTPNVFADEWDDPFPPTEGWRSHIKRVVPPGQGLGMSVWELEGGQTQVPYHFHHGADELILVLSGRPTLRTPEGEHELEPGDVVHFPRGPAGAHQVVNRTDRPTRYVLASSNSSPEIVEYPDSGKLAVASRLDSQRGERLWSVLRFDDVDYFEGEQPRK